MMIMMDWNNNEKFDIKKCGVLIMQRKKSSF